MAAYLQSLKKPLATTGLMNTRFHSSTIINKTTKPIASNSQSIHVSAKNDFPQAEPMPLPINVDPSESMRFSPQRSRDITSMAIATNIWNPRCIDITIDASKYDVKPDSDPHVHSYDCTGAVSLNSSMQSNVPSPFGGMHKFTHLNMPGGQWSQSNKWMSHDLHSSHYTTLRREVRKNMLEDEKRLGNATNQQGIVTTNNNIACMHGYLKSSPSNTQFSSLWMQTMRSNAYKTSFACLTSSAHSNLMPDQLNAKPFQNSIRRFSDKKENKPNTEVHEATQDSTNKNEEAVALTPRAKLKNAIRDYGSTVLVFHIAISLVSLGIFYQLVSSGLDVVAILNYLGLGSTGSTISSNVASGASTFVVAYAVHKVFAPFRISITLVSAPFIVRYLRNKGILSVKSSKKP